MYFALSMVLGRYDEPSLDNVRPKWYNYSMTQTTRQLVDLIKSENAEHFALGLDEWGHPCDCDLHQAIITICQYWIDEE